MREFDRASAPAKANTIQSDDATCTRVALMKISRRKERRELYIQISNRIPPFLIANWEPGMTTNLLFLFSLP